MFPKWKIVSLVVIAVLSTAVSEPLLGIATDYNLFALGTVSLSRTDAQGKIAGQGSILIESYTVGSSKTSSEYSLIGAGYVEIKNSTIENGGLYAHDAVLGSSTVYGDVRVKWFLLQYGGGLFGGNLFAGGNNAIIEDYLQPKLIYTDPGDCPINFIAASQYLNDVSQYLNNRVSNGTVTIEYNQITLSGTDNMIFFSLPIENLAQAVSLTFSIPSGAKAVVNVSGMAGEIKSFGLYNNNAANILFNFHQATNLNIHNIGFKGSILAPQASIEFNSGHLDGNLICKSITGDVELHNFPFDCELELPPPSINPVLERVIDKADGTYSAIFGYDNPGRVCYITPGTSENEIQYQGISGRDLGQPEEFREGRVKSVVTIDFDGSPLTWNLAGNTVTASGSDATRRVTNDADEDYLYRPYPNLLVHGFNSTPYETFKLPTKKRSDDDAMKRKLKDTLLYSTFIDKDPDSIPNKSTTIPSFLLNNLDPNKKRETKDKRQFADFYQSTAKNDITVTRMSPYEEESSYTGLNHTFVEAHCYNYSYESNDKDMVKYPHFSRLEDGGILPDTAIYRKIGTPGFDTIVKSNVTCECGDDEYGCYHLAPSAAFPTYLQKYGGQAQHIRVRIIQLLNEYYGDWKWVNDPTAKINIICHSNGGLLTTYALAYDSLYYNNGYTYTDPGFPANCWLDQPYHITGLGFRLADHVNQVITIDTPFDGSPLADKNGTPSDLVKTITRGLTNFALREIVPYLTLPGVAGAALLYADEINDYVTELAYSFAVHGSNTPIMLDFGPGSEFNISFHESKPPCNSQGELIPYFNIIGQAKDIGLIAKTVSEIFKVRAVSQGFRLRFAQSKSSASTAKWAHKVANWCLTSDFIVPVNSQTMKSIYPDHSHEISVFNRGLLEPLHMNISNEEGGFAASMAVAMDYGAGVNGYSIKAPWLICANQPDENSRSIITRTDSRTCANETVSDTRHSFIRFDGMCGTPDQRWLSPVRSQRGFQAFHPDTNTGKPEKIVVYVHDYFLNEGDIATNINLSPINDTVKFYDITQSPEPSEGVGSWSSRFVDSNNDVEIDENDLPGGCWAFLPVDTSAIKNGYNLVTVVKENPITILTAKNGKGVIRKLNDLKTNVSIRWGNYIDILEVDENGNDIGYNKFLYTPVRWNFGENEIKHVYFGFNPPVDGSHADNKVSVKTNNGEMELGRVNGVTPPSAGQYRFFQINSKWFLELALGSSQLQCDSTGNIQSEQILHFVLVDTALNQCNSFIPFYIDNTPPEITINDPLLKGDFNGDGLVDTSDHCVSIYDTPSLPPCASICDSLGIIDDPLTPENECTEAQNACNNTVLAPQVEVAKPDCDNIDNDFDGFLDDDDISESSNIKFFSPRWDSVGKCINPVDISFGVVDEMIDGNTIISLHWAIYKAAGDAASPTDIMVYSKVAGSNGVYTQKMVSTSWDYLPFTSTNPPSEGLYYMKVFATDLAGYNVGEMDTSGPAYFIIDRTPPGMTILENWQDENGNHALTSSSQSYRVLYKPGTANGYLPGKFGSEADKVTITFHPAGGLYAFVKPLSFESIPDYNDLLTYSSGSGFPASWESPDGTIDPTIFELPLAADFDTYSRAKLNNWLINNKGLSTQYADSMAGVFGKMLLKDVLLNGKYTVEYSVEDKAGNVTVYHDVNDTLQIETGLGTPVLEETGINVNKIENRYSESDQEWETTTDSKTGSQSDSSDAVDFLWVTAVGDFSMIINIKELQHTGVNIAGLMVRKSLDPDAIFAAVSVDDNQYASFSYRTSPGADKITSGSQSGYQPPNVWLKLRTGRSNRNRIYKQ